MTLTTLLQLGVAFALGAASATYTIGCPETRLRFDGETGKITPVVSPGDVVAWDVPVEWIFAKDNPCDQAEFTSSGGTRCKVLESANHLIFPYRCKGGAAAGCDPDIMVDDDFRPIQVTATGTATGAGGPGSSSGVRAAGAFTLTDANVHMTCNRTPDPDVAEVSPIDKNDRTTGETVQWLSRGTDHLTNWKVTFEGTDEEKKSFCANGDYELTTGEQCKLAKPSTTFIYYTVTSDNCGPYRARVTVK